MQKIFVLWPWWSISKQPSKNTSVIKVIKSGRAASHNRAGGRTASIFTLFNTPKRAKSAKRQIIFLTNWNNSGKL
jgi:hypothetical protein